MKKTILFTMVLLCNAIGFSQSFNYQAVVRDASDSPLINQSVGVQIKVIEGSASGTTVYTETHTVISNAFGVISLSIGEGTTTDAFSTIDWSMQNQWLDVSVDITGGTTYSNLGTSKLNQVPYAMYAASANNLTTPYTAGAGIDIATNEISTTTVGWLRTNGNLPTSINNSIYTNGNVGFGTSSPSFPIDVQGTFGERIRTYSKDGYYAGVLAKNNTREFFMGVQADFETNNASSGFHIYDNTAGSQRMVIDKDGNMGINQANPTARLQVNGTFRIVDGTQGDGKVLTSSSNGTASWVTSIDNVDDADADPTNEIELPESDGADGQFLQTDGAGVVSWATADADPTNEIELPASDGTDGQFLQTDGAGVVSWATHTDADDTNELISSATLNGTALEITDAGGTNSVELNSLSDQDWDYNTGTGDTGEIYHSGQVSIGATSATVNTVPYRLYSERASTDGAAIMGYNGTSRGLLGVWNNNFTDVNLPLVQSVGVLGYCPAFANNNRAAVYGYSENTLGTTYAGVFQAIGANTSANYGIYVNAANSTNDNFSGYFLGEKSYFEGNVGIGELIPAAKLHVNGNILADTVQGDTILAGTATLSSTLNGSEAIVIPGGTSDYIISAQDGNGRIQHKWNASHGTNETFLVGGEDAAFIDFNATASDNNAAWIEFKHADGASASAGSPISWNTQMIINQGGEVGINETSPDDMLHVTSAGNGTRVRTENSGDGWAGLVAKNTQREMFIGIQGAFDTNPGEFHIYDNTAGSRRFVIDAAGEVGIGRNNPSVKLDVNGSVNCTGGTCSSDKRWKRNIVTLPNVLDNIKQMRGVSYFWKTEEFPDQNFKEDKQIGLIAQEVEKVYPELVKTNEEGYKSMDYMSLTAVLLEAVKEQQKEIESLKEINGIQSKNNETLEARLSKIEALLNMKSDASVTDGKDN